MKKDIVTMSNGASFELLNLFCGTIVSTSSDKKIWNKKTVKSYISSTSVADAFTTSTGGTRVEDIIGRGCGFGGYHLDANIFCF